MLEPTSLLNPNWITQLDPSDLIVAGIASVSAVVGGFVWFLRLEGRVNTLEQTTKYTESALTRLENKIDRLLEHFLPDSIK